MTENVDNEGRPLGRQTSPLWWWLIFPIAALAWAPIRMCSQFWLINGSPLIVQVWIPVAVAWLIWMRRFDWVQTANELEELFPDPRDARRSGNMILILLGIFGLTMALVVSMPPLSIFSLWLVLFGAVFYLYGPFLLRVVLVPLLLLLLMIPPPHSIVLGIVARYQAAGATMLGGALELLGVPNRVMQNQVTVNQTGFMLNISASLSGVAVFLFALLGTTVFLIWKRANIVRSLVALIIAAFLTFIVNLIRLLLVGLAARQNPAVADGLLLVPALPAILCSWALTFLFTRKLLSTSARQEAL